MSTYDDGLDDFFGRPTSGRTLVVLPPRRETVRSAQPARPARAARPAPRRSPVPTPAPRPRQPQPRLAPPLVDQATAARRTKRRLIACVAAVVALAATVTVRLADVQISQRDQWMAMGIDARDGYQEIPAGRGAIVDRKGQPFALSVARANVVADPKYIEEPTQAALALAPILKVDVATLQAKLSKPNSRYQLLAATVDEDVRTALEEVLTEEGIVGITFQDQFVRHYPSDNLARGIVGMTAEGGLVDEDGRQGLRGVELAYEDQLMGTPGRRYFERDTGGNTIADTPESVDPAKPGTDVYLTLDQSLQYSAEQALIDQVDATGADEAMAIITKPSTGEILAMASVARGEDDTITSTKDNRPVSTVFEPGSVSKMITVASAMEEGIVTPNTMLNVPDHLTLYDHTFTDHDPHPDQSWTTTDILVTSSNIGTIKIAQQLGKEKIDAYQRAFGFGQASGSDIPGEVNGLMLDPDDWSGTSIGAIPIGQGISVTALQMLGAYNVISNDGVYVAPRLVGATDDGSGPTPTSAGETRRVLSVDNAQAMRLILSKVVGEGTGSSAAVPGYTAFGKTGTARIPQDHPTDPTDAYRTESGGYEYQSSFVGGIDGADLSIIVTVKNAQTSIYGGQVAAPIFAQLASLALRSEQVPPPALVAAAEAGVPELSTSAKAVDGEDPGLIASTKQG
ncbi:MAG: penicillin-binding protein 2 [Aquihabitans sp.]